MKLGEAIRKEPFLFLGAVLPNLALFMVAVVDKTRAESGLPSWMSLTQAPLAILLSFVAVLLGAAGALTLVRGGKRGFLPGLVTGVFAGAICTGAFFIFAP